MLESFEAVYRDGAFHPTVPPDLAEGTPVRMTIQSPQPSSTVSDHDPKDVLARILATARKFDPETDRPEVTSRNVDEILYGGLQGVR